MTEPSADQSSTHPIVAAVRGVRECLTSVAQANPTFMATAEKAAALLELGRAEAQLVELRLRVLADAGDVAQAAGARDVAAWLAHRTRVNGPDARAAVALATVLDRDHPVLGAAMREGTVNPAQGAVIARALRRLGDLPAPVAPEILARAEERLVAHADDFGPTELARLGRKVLAVLAPEIAEQAEARRLAELEATARAQTRLTLRRQGDGTTRIVARVPDAAATRLATYLAAYTNPRQHPTPQPPDPAPGQDPVARVPYPRRLGEAFCAFLETLDPHRLPVHGGDATTVIVTLDLETLRTGLGTADLLGTGHLPGSQDGAGDRISAAQARRLACTAKILPAVLGGQSLPLDLGRAQRLFTPTQRKALLLRDQTCRTEGCDIPGTWAEAHHLTPWTSGGTTDLANGVLLCSHHHHRIHDDRYHHDRQPNGDLRFHRRR